MAIAIFDQETRDFYEALIKNKPLETKIKYLEIAERQKYHYYCDCSDRQTTEQSRSYERQWNEIITMIDELKRSRTTEPGR